MEKGDQMCGYQRWGLGNRELDEGREGNGNPLQCSCLENPGKGEPGRLLSMGSHRVGHN